jgi:hypothetical protein
MDVEGLVSNSSHRPAPEPTLTRSILGNIADSEESAPPETLGTPILKSQIYTTGRGGSGNMTKNDDPEQARIAQDLDVPPQRLSEGPVHTGRGELVIENCA